MAAQFWELRERMQVPLVEPAQDGAYRLRPARAATIAWSTPPTRPAPARRATATRSCARWSRPATAAERCCRSSTRPPCEAAFRARAWPRRSTITRRRRARPGRFAPLALDGDACGCCPTGASAASRSATNGTPARPRCCERARSPLVVTSRPVHLYDRSLFLAHGQDPALFDAVVVKSPHCQHHMLRRLVRAHDQRRRAGLHQRQPAQPGPHALPRPIFPLDDAVLFVPRRSCFSGRSARPANDHP